MSSVMVDIETEGPDPGRHAMLQLAAVVFDEKWKVEKEFNMYLARAPSSPTGHRGSQKDTVEWWQRTAPHRYQEVKDQCQRGATPQVALSLFFKWLPPDPLLWAWPTCFDIAFLQSYARDYFPLLSQHLWTNADVRSWMSGCIASSGAPMGIDDKTRPPFEGEEHDALFDAKWQVWLMGKFERDLNIWRKSVRDR